MASRGGGVGGKAKSAGTFAFVAPTFAFDGATDAWVNAVVRNGGSVSALRKVKVNDLVLGMKADGVWNKIDRLWLFAAENSASALTDVAAASLATPVTAPTFQADRGYTGNGTTSYIDSNYNPATQGVKYIRDSASSSIWCNTSRAAAGKSPTGAADVSNHISDIFNYIVSGGTGLWIRINSGGGSTLTNGGSRGFFTVNRSGASSCEGYFNGLSLGTTADASNGTPNVNYWICANNLNGTINGPSDDQIAAVVYGGSLTAGEAASLHNHMHIYMGAVGNT